MKRPQNDESERGETKAVLQRLQRFSDDPERAEFRPGAEAMPPPRAEARPPRRVGLLVAMSVCVVALTSAGAFFMLGTYWPPNLTVASLAPKQPQAHIGQPGLPAPPKIVMVVPSNQKVAAQISPDRGNAKSASAPKVTGEEAARAEQLVARGDAYLADGNVMGARDFYERAADIGLAAAAIRLAETYDPGALQRLQALGVVPDSNQARRWYERARALGAREAVEPLSRLTAK